MDVNNNVTFKICYPFPEEWGPDYPKLIVMLRFACYYAIPLFIIGIFYVLIAKHLIYSASHVPGELQGAQRQVIMNNFAYVIAATILSQTRAIIMFKTQLKQSCTI